MWQRRAIVEVEFMTLTGETITVVTLMAAHVRPFAHVCYVTVRELQSV
jgi:hypothetical protein